MESSNISSLMNFIKMKLGRRNKYSKLWFILLLATLLFSSIKGVAAFPPSNSEPNLEPFMGTFSALKGDLFSDSLDDIGEEFNMKPEEKVELNLNTKPNLYELKKEVRFGEEFKNATYDLTKGNDDVVENEKTRTETQDKFKHKEVGREEELKVKQSVLTKEVSDSKQVHKKTRINHTNSFDMEDNVDDMSREGDEDNEEKVTDKDKEQEESKDRDNISSVDTNNGTSRDYENVQEPNNSRRVLKLNLNPSLSTEESTQDTENVNRIFKDKMLHVIDSMRRLKKEIIEKNMELDNLFLEVDQLRMTLSQEDNRVYKTLFKDVESLTKDLNLLRKGNIYYNGDSYNILNNITIMEALHGLYVIYRTPFILLRHNFKVYASFEMFLYKLFKQKIPKLLRSILSSFCKIFKNFMNYSYGNTLKFTRVMYIHHSINLKTMKIYDTLLTDFLKEKLKVDVSSFGYSGSSHMLVKLGVLLTKFKVIKHYKYLRHSTLNNLVIQESFLNRNRFPSMDSNPDFLYIKDKDHKMLEVLYHIYRLKLYCFWQRFVLLFLRYVSLFCNLFVKDSLKSINTYTKPMFNLREDSLFRVRNLYVMLRSVSIMTLQRVDVFMDYCFNYANKLNPELSILVPKDLSNRIFFISVIILLTFLLVFVLQLLFHSLLGFFNSVFLTGTSSKSRLQSKLRHWYHRSFLRHFLHILRKGLTNKPHKKRRYHRNFENYHRVIDDGGVTNSDNYKQFKHSHKNS